VFSAFRSARIAFAGALRIGVLSFSLERGFSSALVIWHWVIHPRMPSPLRNVFENSMLSSIAKNDVIPAKGRTAFSAVSNFISQEVKSRLDSIERLLFGFSSGPLAIEWKKDHR
jgi:hypothetical protein